MAFFQSVHGTPMDVAMVASRSISSKQFLPPSNLRRERHRFCRFRSPRRKLFVSANHHIGRYLDAAIADREEEEAIEHRRTVFNHEDWIRHRSSSRHGRHLLSIVSSRVILALGPPVFSLTAVAAVITFYNEALSAQMLPPVAPPPAHLQPALLSHRPRSRPPARLPDERLIRQVRRGAQVLGPQRHQIPRRLQASADVNARSRRRPEACERIFKTPIPLSYTRLTSRFLVVWHIALPLGLWDQCRWLVIPAVFFNAAALLCIEEVGVLIEEPFSTLALGAICHTIRHNVAGLVDAHTEYAQKTTRRSCEAKL